MAINKKSPRGFALLIAVIFTSVMLSFGTALASLGYKQQLLASGATQSQNAFYAADAALECTLLADQKGHIFDYAQNSGGGTLGEMDCNGVPASGPPTMQCSVGGTHFCKVTEQMDLDDGVTAATRCADVTIYKYESPDSAGNTTYIFAQGYNTSCSVVAQGGSSFVARGLYAKY